ncbi:hypothetical protein GCM10027193_25710 [Arenimonas aestuarii]
MDATSRPVTCRWADSPAEALQRARAEHPGRDVLLLREGVEPEASALERLHAAWHEADWDVLSPLDGRWPLGEQGDTLAWTFGEHAAFAWDGWSAECSLWRGGAATTPDTFGDGLTGRCGLLPCVQVGQAAPAAGPPPLPVRALLAMAGTPGRRIRPGRPVVLHVLHAWGGGAERFVRDLMQADTSREHLVLVARGADDRPPFGRELCLHADLDAPPLQAWPLAAPIADCSAASPDVEAVLAQLLARWNIGAVLVSSLIGHSLDVLRTGLPTALCAHDLFPAWPLLHDARDPACAPFDEATLAAKISEAGPGFLFATREASRWWALREELFASIEQHDVALVAPSTFARDRYRALAPALAGRAWTVINHGLAPFGPLPGRPQARPGAPLRVLVPGRVHGAKGSELLDGLVMALPAGVELVLLGTGPQGHRYLGRPGVHVKKDYRREDLPRWLSALAPDLALLPSTVPETWSYTLSEMWALGLPVLCAGLGAPAERIAETGAGWCLAGGAEAFGRALSELAADRQRIEAARTRIPAQDEGLAPMAAAWVRQLPTRPAPLLLPAAGPDCSARLALAESVALRDAALRNKESALAEQSDELARRADWAFKLQTQLQGSERHRQALATELQRERAELESARRLGERQLDSIAQLRATLERNSQAIEETQAHLEQIARLDQQLADAHGYYQRDCSDLARQRDVALGQRDELNKALTRVQSSFAWRLARRPQQALDALRSGLQGLAFRLRRLRSLGGRAVTSLRVRGWAGTLERWRQRRAAPPGDNRLLPRSPSPSASGAALRLPRPTTPRASIIVPVYNQLHMTLACLRALADSGDGTDFEVIVVDDGSSDATAQLLPTVPGLVFLRNAKNLGFIGACNAGAAKARGEFLVFLNNDTTVQPGWLDALLATFDQYPDTGLAGSKLVYPDGQLQEAGGIIFADGSCWNYGRFEDPAHPRFNFVREVDYCSGASIAIRRELFDSLDGFDAFYAPAYYEDTDLAMRVRRRGLKVRYQPASVVVHHEGVTSGTDTGSGVKAYQVANQVKFVQRWREVLAGEHQPPSAGAEVASERGRKHRVLVLDACTPTPDRDSGSLRMTALLRLLREEGCSVVFFPENRAHDGAYTNALQQLGVETWWHPWLADVPRWLAQHGERFDLVIGSRHYVLGPVLPLLRSQAPHARVVFDTVDLHFLREQREAELAGDTAGLRTAARTRKAELALVAQADLTWVVSEAERLLLAGEAPDARVDVVSNIHDIAEPGPGFDGREGLLFVGGFRHPPNVDAALWLATDILPRIHARHPGLPLHLVGGDSPPAIKALGQHPDIHFHGYVPDLGPLLREVRISVAPLRYGAGVKGKVNQALAHGLPVVATTCAVEGMHLVDGEDVLVADDADTFADAVLRLHDDAVLWSRLSEGGLENTRRHFSPDVVRAPLRRLLDELPGR